MISSIHLLYMVSASDISHPCRMSSALLSRFDLVFILLDCPDEEMDSLLSEHVMSLHAGGRSTRGRMGRGRGVEGGSRTQTETPAFGELRATARRTTDVRFSSPFISHSYHSIMM